VSDNVEQRFETDIHAYIHAYIQNCFIESFFDLFTYLFIYSFPCILVTQIVLSDELSNLNFDSVQ